MRTDLVNVVITRDEYGLEDALNGLNSDRFKVCPCATISARPVPLSAALASTLRKIDTFDFVVFTSQHAVTETVAHLRRLDRHLAQLEHASVCAVGPVTAQLLARHGAPPKVMPSQYTAIALAELFPVMHRHSPRVLFLRGNWASDVIPRELHRKGYQVTSVVIYETSLRETFAVDAQRLITNGNADCIAFTSPSSVRALQSLLGSAEGAGRSRVPAIASIGPTTSAACAQAGLKVEIQPTNYTLRGLADAIARHFDSGNEAEWH